MAKWYERIHARGVLADMRTSKRFRVAPSKSGPKQVFVTCHYCGYDPCEVPNSGTCPKCGGSSWERFAISKRLMMGMTS